MQNLFSRDLAGILGGHMAANSSIGDLANSILTSLLASEGLMNLFFMIALGYCVVKVFFANIKRGGILLTQIAVGSLYMFSIPKGYTDGFVSWCKQVIALCLTAFLQMTLLFLGLLTWQDSMIERALMTPDELKSLPKGTFVVTKTGAYPMQVRLKLFFDWGIKFPSELYDVPDKGNRIVAYARKEQLQAQISEVYPIQADESIVQPVANDRHFRKPNTIARDNKCSVPTVKRAIDELVRKGYVTKDARWRDNGGRTSNSYVCEYITMISSILS